MEKDGGPTKATRNRSFQDPGKSAWHSVEVSKTVLWPESVSAERCVELCETQRESEEEDTEEERGSFCLSPESGEGDRPQGARRAWLPR